MIVHFVDIGRIVDHHSLNFLSVMVNNSTNINKMNNDLSPKKSLYSDDQQFYQYQQNEQLPHLFKLPLGERPLFILLILVELLTITV
jgi:hypothetical protein